MHTFTQLIKMRSIKEVILGSETKHYVEPCPNVVVVVVLTDSFRGWGWEELFRDPTFGLRLKFWTGNQSQHAGEGSELQIRDNSEGEQDPAVDNRRRCKKNSLPFYPA